MNVVSFMDFLKLFGVVYLPVKEELPCQIDCFNLGGNLHNKVIAEHHWSGCLSLCHSHSFLCYSPFFLVFSPLICKLFPCNFHFPLELLNTSNLEITKPKHRNQIVNSIKPFFIIFLFFPFKKRMWPFHFTISHILMYMIMLCLLWSP